MANLRPAIAIAIGLLISACSDKPGEAWVALNSIPVYASYDDVETRMVFTLATGDACTPLRSVEMKVYLHTEIQCEKKRGWVTDDRNFEIKTTSRSHHSK